MFKNSIIIFTKLGYNFPTHFFRSAITPAWLPVLQAALSIVWNCTDKSVELCSSVARCGVVQLLLSELEAGRPTAAAAASHKDRLYLAKAYLGILHNVARLCAPSRAGFRAARAVTVLRAWVPGAPPPVEARVYLTLAYVVTEGDSGALAAAPDRIAFLIDILRDALACEAHFSATHAFCAAEITCGLNHLAINDANKASLGEAGVITLYTDMLRVQHAAECLLAAAGLWILAFHRDNAARIRREDGCVQGGALRTEGRTGHRGRTGYRGTVAPREELGTGVLGTGEELGTGAQRHHGKNWAQGHQGKIWAQEQWAHVKNRAQGCWAHKNWA